MSIGKKIVGQSSVYFAGTLFSIGIGFFFKMYIAKELGSEMLGIYALGLSIVTILSTFVSLGLGNGLVKYVSRYIALKNYKQLHTYLRKTLELTLFLSLIAASLFFIFPKFIASTLLDTPELVEYMPFFGVLLVINALITLADQTIRGLQEVKKSTIIGHFIRLPFKIIVAVALVYTGYELRGYIWAELLGAIIALLLLGRLVLKLLPNQMDSLVQKADGVILKEERRFGNNMLIINTVGLLQSQGDKILLAVYLSTTELGIYSIILAITAFIPTILVSVNSIFAPIISQLYVEDKISDLRKYYQLSSKYVFVLTFPLIAFLASFNDQILSLFGEEFRSGELLLILILTGELINNSTGSIGMMLGMMGLERKIRNISLFSTVFTFLTYILLTSNFGLIGLGIGLVISRFLMNFISVYILYKDRNIIAFELSYIKTIIAFMTLSLALVIFNYIVPFPKNNITIMILSFFLVYFIFVGVYIIMGKNKELIVLKNMIFK